jgi:hypothetical protein
MANDTVETRLRRMAKRRGYELVKCRRRDPASIGFGKFHFRELWGTRVIGVLPEGGFGLVDAPDDRGGAQRFAIWLGVTSVERILAQGLQ